MHRDCSSALCDAVLQSETLRKLRLTHCRAAVLGVLRLNLPLCSSLILTYADFNDRSSTQALFEESPRRGEGAFLWNSFVRALTKLGLHGEALRTYNRMVREGVRPDDRTFPFVLTTCSSNCAISKGKELHGSVVKTGFSSDVFVGNTLVAFYGACSLVSDATQLFDEMLERDVVSWNTLISLHCHAGGCREAVRCFRGLARTTMAVNSVSVVSALSACSGMENSGRGIHGSALKLGLDSQVNVGNVLVDMYSRWMDLESSVKAFNCMAEKNDVTWNALIGGLVHGGLAAEALRLFRIMVGAGILINSVTVSSFLPGLAELGFYCMGREVHGHCVRRGWDSDLFVANTLLDMYAKCGRAAEASSVFHTMQRRNEVSWNAMIANLAQNKREEEAIGLVRVMHESGERPNSVTLANVLPACARVSASRPGKEIHGWAIRAGFSSDLFISNALVDVYAKSGRLGLARSVFDVSQKDKVTYNAMIMGLSRSPQFHQALDLFVEMGQVGLDYDAVSFMGALAACGGLPSAKPGRGVHGLAIRRQLHVHLFVANSLLDLYTKRGDVNTARIVFDGMQSKDVASWNAMILGYGMQGEYETAIELFDQMEEDSVAYDGVSYVAVLSACSHCKLVERGKKYFDKMLGTREIKPTEMHYSCMVDLLGRAGLMEEAVEFVKELPFQPGSDIWGALLGAARVHGDLELGRWAAEHLFQLKPGHSGYYTLLSNMYAEAGRWDEAIEVRKRMKSKRVKKNPGCSWVDAGGRTCGFLVGGENLDGLGSGDIFPLEF
ncbi:pentatricopeptide repeat-containing protein At1g18485-like [Wolffia australiana]